MSPSIRPSQQGVERRLDLVGLDIFRGAINLPVDAGERELLGRAPVEQRLPGARQPVERSAQQEVGGAPGRQAPTARRRPRARKRPETSTPGSMSSTPSTGGRHRVQLCSSCDTPSVGSTSASRARLVCCASRSSLILALMRMTAVGRRSVVTISHLGVSILQYLAVATDKANSRRGRTPSGGVHRLEIQTPVTLRPGAPSTRRERRECRLSDQRERERCRRLFQ